MPAKQQTPPKDASAGRKRDYTIWLPPFARVTAEVGQQPPLPPPSAPRGRIISLPPASSVAEQRAVRFEAIPEVVQAPATVAAVLQVPPLSHIAYDVRCPPSTLRSSSDSELKFSHLDIPFCSSCPRTIRLVSRDFPWSIDVRASDPWAAVTCQDVLRTLYEFLQAPLTDSDWGFCSDKIRRRMLRAWKRRHARILDPGPLRRVDLLGGACKLQGFYRDEQFSRQRMFLRREERERVDVWVVKFMEY
ncbi:hypothetical protein MKEN_00728000 [Mycena kentingensis (nom. inval.)]|nr:hypothetical protein MKEN_00728000 [Mycena kentingensis (nom. inval.)]